MHPEAKDVVFGCTRCPNFFVRKVMTLAAHDFFITMLDEIIERTHKLNNQESLRDASSSPPAPGEPVMNYAAALSRLGGDADLFQDLAQFFLEDTPDLLQTMRMAITSKDAAELERAAHSMKGLAANFDGLPAVKAALIVERMGHAGDWNGAVERVEEIEREVMRLSAALRPYLKPEA